MNEQTDERIELTEVQQLLAKINNESNATRIKLEVLRRCYISLAQGYHEIAHFGNSSMHHRARNWRDCENISCKSNKDVLIKLELE